MDGINNRPPPPSLRSTKSTRSLASVFSLRSKSSNASLSSFRTATPVPKPTPDAFGLPTRLKDVKVHKSPPTCLPDAEANVHAVRYFLFQLLTSNVKLVKHYPQWILETVAFWHGTGKELREMSQNDLQKLCPFSAGHATLEIKGQTLTDFPECAAKDAIGRLIAQTVGKLQGNEGLRHKRLQEWQEILRGNTSRDSYSDGQSHGWTMRGYPGYISDTSSLHGSQKSIYAPTVSDSGTFNSMAQWYDMASQSSSIYGLSAPRISYVDMNGNINSARVDEGNSPTSSGGSAWPSRGTTSTPTISPSSSIAHTLCNNEDPNRTNQTQLPSPKVHVPAIRPPIPPLNISGTKSCLKLHSHYAQNDQSTAHYGHNVPPILPHHSKPSLPPARNENTWSIRKRHISFRSSTPSICPSSSSISTASTQSVSRQRIIMNRQPFQQQTKFNAPQAAPPGFTNIDSPQSSHEMPSNSEAASADPQQRSCTPVSETLEEDIRIAQQYMRASTPYPSCHESRPDSQRVSTPAPMQGGLSPQPQRYPTPMPSSPTNGTRSDSFRFALSTHLQQHEIIHQSTVKESIHTSNHPSTLFQPTIPQHPHIAHLQHPQTPPRQPRTVRPPVNHHSMNYPQSNIAAPRTHRIPLHQSSPISTNLSLLNPQAIHTLRPKPPHPDMPTTIPPYRSPASQSIDRFALESGAYLAYKTTQTTPSAYRSEVVEEEIRRMQGMVSGPLYGEGIEYKGPVVRMLDPGGRPYLTLVEQIRRKEVLDGRGKGRRGLDSETVKNELGFHRGM